jgi:hypothetical protein
VKIDMWNVGTFTSRSIEKEHSFICCVQETKWKEEKAKEMRKRYKIINLDIITRTITRNVVKVILNEEMKIKVIDIGRKSDRIITVKLVFKEKY